MVTDHIFYDKRTLQACSLTCRSWYIAALPHLHHTLKIFIDGLRWSQSHWYVPIQRMNELGLCPLVKKLFIRAPFIQVEFSLRLFNDHILLQFSALTNIRELSIYTLDISSFFPTVRQHFAHFLPTVRSLNLESPRGSSRQIVFFIGLFPHLEHLKLFHVLLAPQAGPSEDPTLVPPSIPPLRGRLVLIHFKRPEIPKDIISLFGGLRFHYMELFYAYGIRLLLDATAETLETLRLYPSDPRSEQVSSERIHGNTADNPSAKSCHEDFDLSQNRSLRTLEHPRIALYSFHPLASGFKQALSTIRSPVFADIIIIYEDDDISGAHISSTIAFIHAPIGRDYSMERNGQMFEMLREMRRIRDFGLVLCADVWGYIRERAMRELEWVVSTERERGGLGDLSSRLTVTLGLRQSRHHLCELGHPIEESGSIPHLCLHRLRNGEFTSDVFDRFNDTRY